MFTTKRRSHTANVGRTKIFCHISSAPAGGSRPSLRNWNLIGHRLVRVSAAWRASHECKRQEVRLLCDRARLTLRGIYIFVSNSIVCHLPNKNDIKIISTSSHLTRSTITHARLSMTQMHILSPDYPWPRSISLLLDYHWPSSRF